MIWTVLSFIGILGFAVYYLNESGVDPATVNLKYEVGIALLTGAVFALLSSLLSRNPNRKLEEQLEEFSQELSALREEIERLGHDG